MTRKEWTIIGILGTVVVVFFLCLGCLVLGTLASLPSPARPAVVQVVITTTPEQATQGAVRPTDVPQSTRTTTPTDTPRSTDTPQPTRTARPTDTPRSTDTPRPTATNTPRAVYAIGETISVGNWEYKVTRTERTKTLVWSAFGNKTDAKGVFLIVYMTLKNIGTKNFTINTWDFELRDAGGIKYDTSDALGVYSFVEYKKLASLGDQFPPGVPLNTALVFDINPNAKGLTLYLKQARVSIDLRQ